MILGTVLLTAALALFLRNDQESLEAGNASAELMPRLVEAIHDPGRKKLKKPRNWSRRKRSLRLTGK